MFVRTLIYVVAVAHCIALVAARNGKDVLQILEADSKFSILGKDDAHVQFLNCIYVN